MAGHFQRELEKIKKMILSLGALVEETDDGLTIHGNEILNGATIDPHDDHRLAMSFAVAGLRVPGIRIAHEECVDKSFPKFWHLWKRLS